jgi:hypothetical protein
VLFKSFSKVHLFAASALQQVRKLMPPGDQSGRNASRGTPRGTPKGTPRNSNNNNNTSPRRLNSHKSTQPNQPRRRPDEPALKSFVSVDDTGHMQVNEIVRW